MHQIARFVGAHPGFLLYTLDPLLDGRDHAQMDHVGQIMEHHLPGAAYDHDVILLVGGTEKTFNGLR